MSESLRRQVLQLYEEVDAAVAAAGPVCVASGRCCRFKEYGHTLFLSNLEAEVLLHDAPPYDPEPSRPISAPFRRAISARLASRDRSAVVSTTAIRIIRKPAAKSPRRTCAA